MIFLFKVAETPWLHIGVIIIVNSICNFFRVPGYQYLNLKLGNEKQSQMCMWVIAVPKEKKVKNTKDSNLKGMKKNAINTKDSNLNRHEKERHKHQRFKTMTRSINRESLKN